MQNKHFYYWILPAVVVTVLIILNYSGVAVLQAFVAPEINREFGVLENLQSLVILVIIFICIKGAIKTPSRLEKVIYVFGSLFFFVAFLEEIDYGLHFYEYINNIAPEQKVVTRNFHNINDNEYLYEVRQVIIVTLVIFFILLPLLKNKIQNQYIKHFIADKMIITTFIVYVLIGGLLVRMLPKLGMPHNPSLFGNHQEFEELISYYMILLYVYEIILLKPSIFKISKT